MLDKVKIIKMEEIDLLPKTSGVYLFYNKHNIIYIGKAVDIKSRVKNHFHPAFAKATAGEATFKDNILSERTTHIGYIETKSEITALILEANLIKKYQPKFNVIWKDDKNYFYVAIAWPAIYITHQKKDNAEYIGPFVEGIALKKTLRFLRKAFPFYTTATHQKTKCTYCHLDLCPGPELFENPPSPKASEGLREYKKNIKKLILILKGKRFAVLNSLKKEMKQLSKKRDFEGALKIRDKIFALQQIMAHTHVIEQKNIPAPKASEFSGRIECYDISNIQGKFAVGSMVVFVNGKADKSQYKKFKIKMENKPNDIAMLKEVLQRRFLHKEWPKPDFILIDGGKAQLNTAVGFGIKAMAIAKKHNELFVEGKNPPAGKPILLKNLPRETYNLILQLRDEAHRFAITYHKKLRKKHLLQ